MKKTACTVVILLSIFALCFSDVNAVFAATGTNQKVKKKILVILVDFQDRKGKYQAKDFHNLLFFPQSRTSKYAGSFKGYYQEASNGKLEIDGDIIGWYHAPEDHDYYATDEGQDELVAWTLDKIADHVDLAKYDADHDKAVDGIMIVHQGLDKANVPEGEGEGLIHSTSFLYSGLERDGLAIPGICLVPELYDKNNISTIGVFVHEYGHVLDLPDLYDTDYSTEGVGNWDVMGAGNWLGRNQDGDSPTLMSAWTKKQMGWANVIELNKTARNIVINNSVVYQIGGESKEYFLLEHREKGNSSSFDEYIPGSGIGIWHVDERATSNGNDNERKARLVVLEQADGKNDLDKKNSLGDAGDLFTSLKQSFSAKTNPSSGWNNGLDSGIIINNFTRIDNQTMSFDLEIKPSKLALLSESVSKKLTSSKAKITSLFSKTNTIVSKLTKPIYKNTSSNISFQKLTVKMNTKVKNTAKSLQNVFSKTNSIRFGGKVSKQVKSTLSTIKEKGSSIAQFFLDRI